MIKLLNAFNDKNYVEAMLVAFLTISGACACH